MTITKDDKDSGAIDCRLRQLYANDASRHSCMQMSAGRGPPGGVRGRVTRGRHLRVNQLLCRRRSIRRDGSIGGHVTRSHHPPFAFAPPSLPAAPGGRENGRQVRRSCMETPRCCWWRKVRACWMMKMMMQASVARRFSLSACVSLYAFILSLYARPPLQLLPIIYVGKTTCSATINYSPLAFHVTF